METRAGDGQEIGSHLLLHHVTRMDTAEWNGSPLQFMIADARSVVESDDTKKQSRPGAPVVLIKDLKKTHGDNVSVDTLHRLKGMPIMGRRHAEGRGEEVTRATAKLFINQTRKLVNNGSRMDQQRRGYDLVSVGKTALKDYWGDYYSELTLYHMAGARGMFFDPDDTIFPTGEPQWDLANMEPQDEVAEAYTNPLMPPTFARHFYAGDAQSIDGANTTTAISTTDTLDVTTIKRVVTQMKERGHPLGTIDLSSDAKPMQTNPFWLLLVTPSQWADLMNSSPEYNSWMANAQRRAAGFNHHLFIGDCAMIDNVLIKQYFRPIRWWGGDTMTVSNNDANATTRLAQVPANVVVDRAILLGRQATMMAVGGDTNGNAFHTYYEKYDGDDKSREYMRWMGGVKKFRTKNRNGWYYDPGVAVIDTHVSSDPARPSYDS